MVPRPVHHQDLVYVSSGYDHPTLYAIEADGIGDVTKKKVKFNIISVGKYIWVI